MQTLLRIIGKTCEMLHLKQHSVQTIQPPSHANLEVLKKSPEKLGDWDLKPGDFQNMYQIKQKKKTDYLFECFFTFLVPPVVSFYSKDSCFRFLHGRWLRFLRHIRVILWFCFALEFWTMSSHFEICACVRRLSFPRDLSAPMFHWNWHCTQVFSQISLINSAVMTTDYSIFLHTLRNILAISSFSGSPWYLEAKLWDCEMAS